MPIAITEDHRALAEVVADFLSRHGSLAEARARLESDEEQLPSFWPALAELGWLGLHIDEQHGGSGFGLAELVVVVEELGRGLAPGPFVPTVIASAVISASAPDDVRARLLPGLVDGSVVAGIGLGGGDAASDGLVVRDGVGTGEAGTVLGGGLADLVLVAVGDDVVVVDRRGAGVAVTVPKNVDPSRRSATVRLDGAQVDVLPGARQLLIDVSRLLIAAEATGLAHACTTQAADYARVREQFGRPIATFQAVKHHLANMLVEAELATAAVWDASRASVAAGEQFSLAAAVAAALAVPAADFAANHNIQVHGGIGFTWEHDAHLYLRRAVALAAIIDVERAAVDITDLVRNGVRVSRSVDLPPEAEDFREAVGSVLAEVKDLGDAEQTRALVAAGYAVPHWPKPWGRDAGAIEQLVIEEEFAAAGVKRPNYGITSWVILTLIQHATDDQIERWVLPALNREVIWCQLFSEPDAGSDAAGVKTKATRVDGGWLVNGQKVWTSGAHYSRYGLATVRTNPDAPKHNGITTMVIDMNAEGVETRPLRMPSGSTEFNEVFFNDVFVPDDDVVGPVDGGWTVARATLGNESVSIGGGQGGMTYPAEALIPPLDANPQRVSGGAGRVGRYISRTQAIDALNMRSAHRAVVGAGPGPEGAVTKLVMSENAHEATAILMQLSGPEGAFFDGAGAISGNLALMHRALSIAGGTSEIKRNQIGERLLGLPRDPLIK